MIWVALGMILVGFLLVAPRGAVAGGAAHRNVPMLGQQIRVTPGYSDEPPERQWVMRLAGGVLLLGGFALAFAVS